MAFFLYRLAALQAFQEVGSVHDCRNEDSVRDYVDNMSISIRHDEHGRVMVSLNITSTTCSPFILPDRPLQ